MDLSFLINGRAFGNTGKDTMIRVDLYHRHISVTTESWAMVPVLKKDVLIRRMKCPSNALKICRVQTKQDMIKCSFPLGMNCLSAAAAATHVRNPLQISVLLLKGGA